MGIIQKISQFREVLLAIVAVATVGSLVVGILNRVTLDAIEPILGHLEKLDIRVEALDRANADDVSRAEFTDTINTLRAEIKTRDEDIIHRLDFISNRVDLILKK